MLVLPVLLLGESRREKPPRGDMRDADAPVKRTLNSKRRCWFPV